MSLFSIGLALFTLGAGMVIGALLAHPAGYESGYHAGWRAAMGEMFHIDEARRPV